MLLNTYKRCRLSKLFMTHINLPHKKHISSVSSKRFQCIAILILLFFITLHSTVLASDEKIGEPGWLDNLMDKVGSGDEYNPEKIIDFGILPGPFYTPEMEIGIGIAAIGLYKTDRDDEEERISTLSISGFASITKAIGLKVENNSFFNRDQFRLFIDATVIDAPEKYWGIGYEQNSNDDICEEYTNVSFSLAPRFYVRLLDKLYVGAGGDFISSHAEDTVPGGLFHQDNPHGTTVNSSGVSFHLMSDTRDFIPNPYKGYLLNADYYEYKKDFGSDSNYSVTELTANKYWAVHENNIIALLMQTIN